jgi:hypothetical protein
MKRKQLNKLKKDIALARRSQQTAANLERFAKALGRKKVKRGKEPIWESQELDVFPLAIPHHGGKDLATGTKNSVLDQLEDDVLAWEQKLDDEDDEGGEGG